MGCALQTREGDGLVTDGYEATFNPALTTPDAGAGAGGADAGAGAGPIEGACTQFALYEQYVAPLLVKKYDASPDDPVACVDCHDGTKSKATLALYIIRNDDQSTCAIALALAATKPDLTQSEIIVASDPSRPDVKHDFKFKTVEEHNMFRDAVLTWLRAERP